MDASKKQREPVAFKSLAELKRFIRPGVEFKTVSHANHADMVGLTRVVTTVQTVGFYSKIKDQPEHPFSTCNHGKGFYTDFGKAGNYIFDGTTVKVKDTRKQDRGVIYELEFYDREQNMEETNMDRKMVNFIKEQYPPGTRIRLNSMKDPYTGEKGYPKLIDEEQLIAANEKRSNKPQLPKKTEAQKVLRRLCGTPPSEQVEQSVTYLLNGLANYPDRIQHRRSPTPVTYSKTQEALDNALEQQPIDEDSAKVLILRLAAEQYAALGNEEYETNRLRRLFSAFECVAELNADLLKNTVSEVLVTRQNVKLRLKNGQIIERSDLQ